jgi:hypothetical protein
MKQFRVDVDFRVTKCIFVDAETAEQAEEIVEQRCKDNPYQYTNNPDYAELDAIVEVNEEDESDPLADYSEDYRKGIAYALEHLDEDDKAIIRAECDKAYNQHLVPDENIVDDHKITDLLEEWGEDNDMPEGWYLDEYDASEILSMV